jgi:chromate transporter
VPTPSLSGLARSVAFDVNRTFGGGNASIELLRRTFTSRAWLDEATHGLFVAIARLTPGTNILAYCVMLGWRHHRAAGSLAALAAASVPASAVVFLLASALVQIDRYWGVQAILAGGILAASVLVLASAWYLIRPYLVQGVWQRALIVTAVAVVTVALGATPVRTLLAAAIVGILLPPRGTAR